MVRPRTHPGYAAVDDEGTFNAAWWPAESTRSLAGWRPALLQEGPDVHQTGIGPTRLSKAQSGERRSLTREKTFQFELAFQASATPYSQRHDKGGFDITIPRRVRQRRGGCPRLQERPVAATGYTILPQSEMDLDDWTNTSMARFLISSSEFGRK